MTSVFNFTFVHWFRSVAPHIHKFRNQTFVVGIAGEAIAAGKTAKSAATWQVPERQSTRTLAPV
jgi:hypothetical protein